ncbi:MAG TPA: hypothetical protein VIE65_17225, partial [Methylobacter sp.]
PDGIFGDVLIDLLKTEGTYTFHAIATYGDTCTATREVMWSMHIDVGVDPGQSDVSVNLGNPGAGGGLAGTVTITPKDKYGNNLGPGRGDGFTVTGVPGTTVTGPAVDNGDGSYTVPVSWDPDPGFDPGVVINQPGRPPVVVVPKPKKDDCLKWKMLFWVELLLLLLILFFIVLF